MVPASAVPDAFSVLSRSLSATSTVTVCSALVPITAFASMVTVVSVVPAESDTLSAGEENRLAKILLAVKIGVLS